MLRGWVLVAFLSAPSSALDEAREAYLRGDFERASEAFARAYADDPRPEFVYAQAQSERQAGRCERAVHLYVRFLELSPEGPDAVKASQNLLHCQTLLLRERTEPAVPKVVPAPAPAIATPAPAPAPIVPRAAVSEPDLVEPPRERERRRSPAWAQSGAERRENESIRSRTRPDPLGGVLVGVGLAGASAGAVLLGVAHSRRADDAPTLGDYRDRIRRNMALERAGLVVLPVSSALLIGGIVRWIVLSRRANVSASRVSASGRRSSAPSPRGPR